MWGSVSRDNFFATILDTSQMRLTRGLEASVQGCGGHSQHEVAGAMGS